jgi:nucleotide-binding universal stress UspA family protein
MILEAARMNPKTLLVPIFSSQGASPAAQAACDLASRFGASVVGLYVVDASAVAEYGEVSPQILDLERERLFEEAAQAERAFMALCNRRGIKVDWRCEEGGVRSVVMHYAHHSDLICLDAPRKESGSAVVEYFIFSTGRPVLVVPPSYAGAGLGHRVAIAWNASRESARAQADAMGILGEADSVSLVTVAGPLMSDRDAGVVEVDAGRLLARHGIELEAFTLHRGSTSVGETLHDWLCENGIDLVIMGAYGHSRLREMVLGGATHWMLRNSTVPMLMSH